MSVDAAPLAASTLIDVLISSPDRKSIIKEKLGSVGVELEWLRDTGDRYRKVWLESAEGGYFQDAGTVAEEFCFLLSWLLSQRRYTEDSSIVTGEVLVQITMEYFGKTGVTYLPSSQKLGMFAWVVGRPLGTLDLSLPAALPTDLLEDDVRGAYDGLMLHVEHAAAFGEFWPEVHRSAILWRLAGIAQGLDDSEHLKNSMQALIFSLSATMPVGLHNRITRGTWLSDFIEDRNAFTHVRTNGPTRAFQASLDRHGSASEIMDYLRLATYFAAGAINSNIRQVDDSRARTWIERIDADYAWVT